MTNSQPKNTSPASTTMTSGSHVDRIRATHVGISDKPLPNLIIELGENARSRRIIREFEWTLSVPVTTFHRCTDIVTRIQERPDARKSADAGTYRFEIIRKGTIANQYITEPAGTRRVFQEVGSAFESLPDAHETIEDLLRRIPPP